MQSLKEGLDKINKFLPSAVYIPFVSESLRNYAVLNIVTSESRLFLTKTRAPFMICLELFRPDEIMTAAKEKEEKKIEDTFHINIENIKRMFKSTSQKKNMKTVGKKLSTLADTRISKPILIKKIKNDFFDKGDESDLNQSLRQSLTSTPLKKRVSKQNRGGVLPSKFDAQEIKLSGRKQYDTDLEEQKDEIGPIESQEFINNLSAGERKSPHVNKAPSIFLNN